MKKTLDTDRFFNRDPLLVAADLLGKVIRHKYKNIWISSQIIETEAYYKEDKASHSYSGYTEKRKAMFMPAGTIYMYYSRGKASLNVSCKGVGNAVLIKSAIPYTQDLSDTEQKAMISIMLKNNPIINLKTGSIKVRNTEALCSGQTLLCRSLGLTVQEWSEKCFDAERLKLDKVSDNNIIILQTTRLGIPKGRDDHLLYRMIDKKHAAYSTKNPLTMRKLPKIKEIFSSKLIETFL